eukprot:scaffold1007_cov176-Amphora_coffeaeformis.AAC.18
MATTTGQYGGCAGNYERPPLVIATRCSTMRGSTKGTGRERGGMGRCLLGHVPPERATSSERVQIHWSHCSRWETHTTHWGIIGVPRTY